MIGFYSLVLAVGVAFSTFAVTTFNSFQNFNSKTSQLIDYETTALASSNRVAKESSKFLNNLKTSLADSRDPEKEAITEKEPISSGAASPSPQDHLPIELLEELIANLEDHTDNQLNKTISYGLKGKQDYKLELIQSDYIPAKLKKEDKKYASTILLLRGAEGDVAIQPVEDLGSFIENNKLSISEKLLSDLFSEKKVEEILTKQEELGLIVSSSGLNLENLPNGLRLYLNKSVILSDSRHPEHSEGSHAPSGDSSTSSQDDDYLSRTAIAQIRVGEVKEVITQHQIQRSRKNLKKHVGIEETVLVVIMVLAVELMILKQSIILFQLED